MSGMSFQEMLDTFLVVTAQEGNLSKVAELLSKGARVDAREQGYTPLLVAAQYGHTEVCELLLANGSDLEEKMPDTLFTALHYAALYGHQSLLQLLLSQNADMNSRSRLEATPLLLASQEGHVAFVVTLLLAWADPLLPAGDGALPIHVAAQENQSEVVRILIDYGGCNPDQVKQSMYPLSNRYHHSLFVARHGGLWADTTDDRRLWRS